MVQGKLILRWKQYEVHVQVLEVKCTDLNCYDVTGLREFEGKRIKNLDRAVPGMNYTTWSKLNRRKLRRSLKAVRTNEKTSSSNLMKKWRSQASAPGPRGTTSSELVEQQRSQVRTKVVCPVDQVMAALTGRGFHREGTQPRRLSFSRSGDKTSSSSEEKAGRGSSPETISGQIPITTLKRMGKEIPLQVPIVFRMTSAQL
ncbi:hypothetical protein J0S82_010505 [Galemys pyrenaicus]|uniref:Uncharacterized protein n=1 Tax=Galemys pyrenaicus TaxID=202257 RepID=A0A8J5ZRQ3_GALPY|nr:hypothetical protein J0S82_010505 [Galemys pyrenaicus]